MTRWAAGVEAVAAGIHGLHGTRGLTVAGGLLLLFAMVEPWLPGSLPRALYAFPLGVVLLVGLATLPREGVAAKRRARALLDVADGPRRMVRRAAWGVALVVALLPDLFLSVQGFPHLSPLAGLVLPDMLRWIAFIGLFGVLLLVVLYLRSSRGYAPDIVPARPNQMPPGSMAHRERDLLQVLLWLIVLGWAWMLQAFWRPFSLLEWHGTDLGGYLASFAEGARGVAGVAFTVIPPVVLFMVLAAHLDLLREVHRRGAYRTHAALVALALLHVALCVLAVVLHAYDLYWIVRYRSLGFL